LADSPPTRIDTAPCVGCGLCCDGTIYWRANAQPDEEQRLTEAGLEVIREGDKQWFVHPCRFSDNGMCTIYDQERFHVCHTFRCKLLKAYQAGEVGLAEARATVEKALALRSEVAAEEPSARLWKVRRELGRELQQTKERPRTLLKIAALDYFIDRWFRA
jgi:hypothetical protein